MRATPESHTHESHAHERNAHESPTHDSHALENHAQKRYPYKNPFCYSTSPYRWKDPTEPKLAHPLSYLRFIGPLIRLWWMMLEENFSRFSEFGFWAFLLLYPTVSLS